MPIDAVRNTLRSWLRTPVLALTAMVTLALGVGVNAAVFSVVQAVLLRPLPYPAPDRIVELFERGPRDAGGPGWRVSPLNYLSWADRANGFPAVS
jgi:putative ABC transport system permease protein